MTPTKSLLYGSDVIFEPDAPKEIVRHAKKMLIEKIRDTQKKLNRPAFGIRIKIFPRYQVFNPETQELTFIGLATWKAHFAAEPV